MSAPRVHLPPQVHVFVRDWLSANHVVLKAPDGCVVIDSGYGKHVPLTLALIALRMANCLVSVANSLVRPATRCSRLAYDS